MHLFIFIYLFLFVLMYLFIYVSHYSYFRLHDELLRFGTNLFFNEQQQQLDERPETFASGINELAVSII